MNDETLEQITKTLNSIETLEKECVKIKGVLTDASSTHWVEKNTAILAADLVINRLKACALPLISMHVATDLWARKNRENDKPVISRPISREEALHISRQTLDQAERERLEVADREAARGV